jgi:hypothetical protein
MAAVPKDYSSVTQSANRLLIRSVRFTQIEPFVRVNTRRLNRQWEKPHRPLQFIQGGSFHERSWY